MQIPGKPTKNKRKVIIILVVVALVLAAGVASYLLFFKKPADTSQPVDDTAPVNTVDYNPPSEAELNDPTINESNLLGESKNPEEQRPPAPSTITIIITRADQAAAGEALNVRSVVQGATKGTCTVEFTKAGQQKITRTSAVSFEVSTAYCNFDIAAADFPENGTWQATLTAADGQNKGSASQDVIINK